jgi:glycosyltransferase involved in cell wall biosynthesis
MTGATIGMLSTYPPTQCGLATFSAALTAQLNDAPGAVGVVRVVDAPQPSLGGPVVAQVLNASPGASARAAGWLNGYDVAVVQHEYGIYGGPDGADVLEVVDALTVPLVAVLHTVREQPTVNQRRILLRLLGRADVVVTMTRTAHQRLVSGYGADPARAVVIPHGAIDLGGGGLEAPLSIAGATGRRRPLVLTWGLLGPGKGIEWAIDAMAGLRDLDPRYLVLGKTHPKVLERSGEDYRRGLLRRARDRGVSDLVELDDQYLGVTELARLVGQADVVLLPYDSREQVTSGVLIEAVAAGRPVVSTAFPHAVELLGAGAGLVVAQRDPAGLQAALRRVLTEPGLAARMSGVATRSASELFWPAVAARYQDLADTLAGATLVAAS